MKVFIAIIAAMLLAGCAASTALSLADRRAQAIPGQTQPPPLAVRTLVDKKVTGLPAGPLYWRIEHFPSLAQAQAAGGRWSLATESAGKAWLFTLGPAGGSSAGGVEVAQVGPIAHIAAPQYLLRINEASGPPGSVTPVHSHPGSEAFLVLAGEQLIRTPHGLLQVRAGQPQAGHGADMAMQVSSNGATDLHALVMFVVDATRPFSVPTAFP